MRHYSVSIFNFSSFALILFSSICSLTTNAQKSITDKTAYVIEMYESKEIRSYFVINDIDSLVVDKTICNGGTYPLSQNVSLNDGFVLANQHTPGITHLCCKFGDINSGALKVVEDEYSIPDSVTSYYKEQFSLFNRELVKAFNSSSDKHVYSFTDNEQTLAEEYILKVLKLDIEYCKCEYDFSYSDKVSFSDSIAVGISLSSANSITDHEQRAFKNFFDQTYNCD